MSEEQDPAYYEAKRVFDSLDTCRTGSIPLTEAQAAISSKSYGSTGDSIQLTEFITFPTFYKMWTQKRSRDFMSSPIPSLSSWHQSSLLPKIERPPSVADRLLSPDLLMDQLLNYQGVKETFFCEICFSYEAYEKGYSLKTCGHRFCRDCLQGYLTSNINDGQVFLNCFVPIKFEGKTLICEVKIREDDIFENITSETRSKYDRFKQMSENPNIRQCSKCKHSQKGDKASPRICCEECGWIYCYHHGDQHPNSTCAEYERHHRLENLKNNALISKIAKNCPKCKSPIQKRSGCNHMKCPQCRCSFCWLCLTEIEDKAMPAHFKDSNTSSGCKGKQFEYQTNPPLPCLPLLSFLFITWHLFVVTPIALALTIVTSILGIFCICYYSNCNCQKLMQAVYSIFTFWASFFLYATMAILGCACMPLFCICACWRIATTESDEDTALAQQYEQSAAQEATRLLDEMDEESGQRHKRTRGEEEKEFSVV